MTRLRNRFGKKLLICTLFLSFSFTSCSVNVTEPEAIIQKSEQSPPPTKHKDKLVVKKEEEEKKYCYSPLYFVIHDPEFLEEMKKIWEFPEIDKNSPKYHVKLVDQYNDALWKTLRLSVEIKSKYTSKPETAMLPC